VHFLALATDYDGTLAHDGVVSAATLRALERLKNSGRRLILVTGRQLPDLARVFGRLDLFDRVIAENGALLYDPKTKQERTLAPPPAAQLVDALRARGVSPLSVGTCIVATSEPNEAIVLETIRHLGLELQITFNKGAVMVLPAGVNKASGLAAALRELELSLVDVVGVGDAENDDAFLSACGCGVAVANALPTLREKVDVRLEEANGAGVAELVSRLCADDRTLVPPAHET
jgi:hydroxymethylpyrimidine pyrophosphatase-like HAD family hydrolase